MKTKLIILTAAAAVLLYSCSDRDDEARQEAIEKVKNSNQNFKLNNSGLQSREGEDAVTNDTIIIRNGLAEDPVTNTDPIDGGDPKDVPIPPRR
ncbi:hypothetical protein JOE44_001988 [Chryseobacterium sp. PvR013]|uniref:hypothetical protein n=1 Tax=Chryseobacterium sp. PvR013 TaxID=2806595 RepID=UPI001AE9A9B8|nr:hypothetical protein [Chryseobacterium sp. PvR013]MBP1165104.1 hypothetical protein [Chryseobacterium sp. PvR013]